MEEFHPAVQHVAGKGNNVLDALSCLDMEDNEVNTVNWGPINVPLTYDNEVNQQLHLLFPITMERELTDDFLLSPGLIKCYQDMDEELQTKLHSWRSQYTAKILEGSNLIHKGTKYGPHIVVLKALTARVLD